MGAVGYGKSAKRYAITDLEFLPIDNKPAVAIDYSKHSRFFVAKYVYESGGFFDFVRSKDVYAFFEDPLYEGEVRKVSASDALRILDLPGNGRPMAGENLILYLRQGWPLRCLECVVYARGGRVHSNSLLSVFPGEPFSSVRCIGGISFGKFPILVVPFSLIPREFVINLLTTFFATASGGVAVSIARRWIRKRRNCCVECGYDVNSLKKEATALVARCPECGCFLTEVGQLPSGRAAH